MKYEFSAGGVVFKKSENKLEILVAKHSAYHGWVFPKGLIGDHIKGETKEETAVREVKEETGITGKILKNLTPTEYWYELNGEKIKKKVYYFLMKYVNGDTKVHDSEMEEVEWLAREDVEDRLSFESDKKVWREAQKLL